MTREKLLQMIARNEELATKWENAANACDPSDPAGRVTAKYYRGLARTFRERKAEAEVALMALNG